MTLARKIISATCVAVAGWAAWATFAAATPAPAPPATTPATTRPTDPFTQEFLRRLESTDATERDAARKELTAITGFWQEPQMLEKMMEVTTDTQLKEVYKQRIAKLTSKIKENVLTKELDPANLPPISLTVSNLPFAALPAALSKSLGLQELLTLPANAPANARAITLDLHDQPFWQVVRAAQRIQPFDFVGGTSSAVMPRTSDNITAFQINGPAMLTAPASMSYRRTSNIQLDGDKARTATLSFTLTLSVDPRVSVVAYAPLVVSRIIDDAAHTLLSASADVPVPSVITQTNFRSQSFSFNITSEPGKRLAVVCDTRLTAVTSRLISTIPDLQELTEPKEIEIGQHLLRVQSQKPPANAKQIPLQLALTPSRTRAPATVRPELTARPLVKVIAGDGKVLWAQLVSGTVNTTVTLNDSSGPFFLTATVPETTVDIPYHFELSDIPLP